MCKLYPLICIRLAQNLTKIPPIFVQIFKIDFHLDFTRCCVSAAGRHCSLKFTVSTVQKMILVLEGIL